VGYADDLIIQGISSAAVGAAFLQLEAAAKQTGLTVNYEQMKAMVQSRRRIGYGHDLSLLDVMILKLSKGLNILA
jgi:uncharacterized membrane protein (Fun14 family)